MPKEIERKFLIADDTWRDQAGRGKAFRQAIIFSENNRSIRIRTIDDEEARLTLKIGIDEMARHEFEYEVPIEDARELLDLARGGRIAKTRYKVEHQGHIWEIDVYEGDLKGLVVAEVELESEDEKAALPPWLGREVTGERRFSNQALAEGSLGKDWRDGI
ncbi:CYTH domain-containing protein [Rhizobium sp. LjRoot254]|uniref:CYTH domain-containing protein n=1 Tax=Rhizobium sp. LjRoot254 TaxID=3342297 RepID=UPI003ECD6E2A